MTQFRDPHTDWHGVRAGGAQPDPFPDMPPSWYDQAACRNVPGDAWYPEKGSMAREAKRICRSCPVKDECLTYALDNDEPFGVWGGMSERERRALKRHGRPAA